MDNELDFSIPETPEPKSKKTMVMIEQSELTRLRSEVDKLNTITRSMHTQTEVDLLRSENKLLQIKYDELLNQFNEGVKANSDLREENVRLRNALFYIQTGFAPSPDQLQLCIDQMQESAADALNGGKNG